MIFGFPLYYDYDAVPGTGRKAGIDVNLGHGEPPVPFRPIALAGRGLSRKQGRLNTVPL